jgi:Fe-S-cluster containining protein
METFTNSEPHEELTDTESKQQYDHKELELDAILSSEFKLCSKNTAFCVTDCNGPCCKFYDVIITPFDLRRIIENIPPLDINKYIRFQQGVTGTEDLYSPILIKGKPYFLGLQKLYETKGCVFQTAIGICGIHTFNPMVCKGYPWAMDEEKQLTYVDKVLCEKLFLPENEDDCKNTIQQYWDELEQTRVIIQEWNEKYGNDEAYSAKDFLRYVNCWQESMLPIHFSKYV